MRVVKRGDDARRLLLLGTLRRTLLSRKVCVWYVHVRRRIVRGALKLLLILSLLRLILFFGWAPALPLPKAAEVGVSKHHWRGATASCPRRASTSPLLGKQQRLFAVSYPKNDCGLFLCVALRCEGALGGGG